MALIVEYHVVADMYTIGSEAITAGMIVGQNAAAQIVPRVTTALGTLPGQAALGIAGDSALAAQGQTTAYSAQLRLGASGANTRWTENRVADFYDETAASNKITVYNGGGKFWVSEELFDNAGAIAPADLLAPSVTTAGEWNEGAADDDIVGIAVGASQAYPSGVPGTDTADNSITLGNYVPLVLRI